MQKVTSDAKSCKALLKKAKLPQKQQMDPKKWQKLHQVGDKIKKFLKVRKNVQKLKKN